MQVRRARIRISRGSHKPDDVPTHDPYSLTQAFHVPVQVRVVVAIHSHIVELVYRNAARFTKEEFADGSGYDCSHGCPSGLQNVDRLMRVAVVNLFKRIVQIFEGEPANGRSHLENGRSRSKSEKHRQQAGDENAAPQRYSSRTTGMPRRTMCDSSSTSQFVSRIHPNDSPWRIFPGSGVPWIP